MNLLNAVSVLQSFKKEKLSPLVAKSATKGFFAVFARIILFLATIAAIYFTAISREPAKFIGDAGGYWNYMYKFFDEDNRFAFTNADCGPRGYLTSYLPLLFVNIGLYIFNITNNVHAFYFGSAIFYAAVFVFVLPYVFGKLFNKKSGVLSTVLFLLPVFFFWAGDFAHPLTDFSSLSLVFISLAAFLKIGDGKLDLFSFLICGAAAAAAYNLRQSYVIFLYAIVASAALKVFTTRESYSFFGIKRGYFAVLAQKASLLEGKARLFVCGTRKALKIAVLVFGAVLIMLPQMAMNGKYRGTNSWQVPTELYTQGVEGKEYPLMLFNTNALQTMQKADFWVVNAEENLIYTTIYKNTPHKNMVRFYDYGSYFKDVFSHPDWYLKSWLNGAFIGMTVTHDAAYITDYSDGFFERLFTGIFILATFAVTVLYLFFCFLRKKGRLAGIKKKRL